MGLSAVSAVAWDLAFRYFMVHRCTASCFIRRGEVSTPTLLSWTSCTLLRLQPIGSMFGACVCGSPLLLLMNGAYSSKCRPKLSQGTLVCFRKIVRHLFWPFSSLLETPLSRASFHRACFVCLVSFGRSKVVHIAFGWLNAKVWVVTDCQPLVLPLTISLAPALNDIL